MEEEERRERSHGVSGGARGGGEGEGGEGVSPLSSTITFSSAG